MTADERERVFIESRRLTDRAILAVASLNGDSHLRVVGDMLAENRERHGTPQRPLAKVLEFKPRAVEVAPQATA